MKTRRARSAILFTVVILSATSLASGEMSEPIVGRVVTPEGKPLAKARVRLGALRNEALYQPSLDPLIAETITDGNGTFALTIPQRQDLIAMAAFHNGALNMELSILGAAEETNTNASESDWRKPTLTRRARGTATSSAYTVYARTLALSTPATDVANLAKGFTLANANLGTLKTVEVAKISSRNADVVSGNLRESVKNGQVPDPSQPILIPAYTGDCTSNGWYTVEESNPWIPVGELHTNWNVTGSFTYGKTADSDLGVGYKWGSGSWSVDGSVHMGNTSGGLISLNRGPYWGKRIDTKFHYLREQEDWWCYGEHYVFERIRSTSWLAGYQDGWDVSFYDGNTDYLNRAYYDCPEGEGACVTPFVGPGEFQRAENKASKYTGGVSAFGVSLTAQSGYSTSVKLHWTFGETQYTHYLFALDSTIVKSRSVYSY